MKDTTKPTINETTLIWENRERIKVLETEISYIKKSIDTVMSNHLPHIQESIVELSKEVQTLKVESVKVATKVAVVIGVAAFIAQGLFNYILPMIK